MQTPRIDIENNNDEPNNGHVYLHPCMNRWHQIVNHQQRFDDDGNGKPTFKNVNNNELFLHRLTTTSPAESIVSAPLTPTGNLIVNILDNFEHHRGLNTDSMNQKNVRNSTNCVIDRNSGDFDEQYKIGGGGGSVGKVPIITLAERRRQTHTKTIPIIPTKPIANGFLPCVTIAINSNDAIDTVLQQCADPNRLRLDETFFQRGYSLSSSAPQCINYWNGSTTT